MSLKKLTGAIRSGTDSGDAARAVRGLGCGGGPDRRRAFAFSERGIAVSDESAEGYKIAGSS